MSANKNKDADRNRRNRSSKINFGDKGKQVLENIDENNSVIKQFREYSLELDNKHDRYEKIVKFNRDITIESKRIIFLLHAIDKDSKRDKILNDAKIRLDNLTKTLFKNIAMELDGQDQYQYLRAYRGGLQEFIEALTFYHYLDSNKLIHWIDFEDSFTYNIESVKQPDDDSNDDDVTFVDKSKTINTLLPPSEYILGVVDLTGELMRKCISDLSTGDITSCFKTCNIVRDMYSAFLGIYGMMGKELNKKIYTLKQSLTKMENVCYTIKIRGSEIPKHMLADVVCVTHDDYNDENESYNEFT